jgi:hypothetical protein
MKRLGAVVLVASLVWTLALPSPSWAQYEASRDDRVGGGRRAYFPIAGLLVGYRF